MNPNFKENEKSLTKRIQKIDNILRNKDFDRTRKNKKNVVTRKVVLPEKSVSICTQRYKNIEKKYERRFKNQIRRTYIETKRAYLHAFNIPFSPSTITPQSDFYTYINYRWIQDTIKKYASRETKNRYFIEVDVFRLTQNKVYQQLIELVKNYLKTEKTALKKRKAIDNVYQSLLKLNSSSVHMHFLEMNDIYKGYIQRDNMLDFMAHLNENEIISWGCPIFWSVSPDPKRNTIFVDHIDVPRLSLYDYLLYLGDYGQTPKYIKYKNSVVRHYINYINKIFNKCLGKDHGLQGKDVFDVEVELLMLMGCEGVPEDPDGYNKVYASESMEKYGFDWKEFSKFLGYKTPPNYFICSNVNYLKCVCKYLNENWKTKKFQAYIFYIILRQMIRFDNDLVNIYYEFNHKFIEGQPEPFPRDLYPIFGLSFTFNTFLTNQYMGAAWNTEYVDFIDNVANDLLHVFKRVMRRNTWLSPKTRDYAIQKLDNLELIIAKPPDMREDPILDYVSNDAWYNMSLIARWKKKKYIELEGKEIVDIPLIDWKEFKLIGTQTYVVNAYYEIDKNKIFIPMAIIQKPFINLDQRDFTYNLARIGYVLGHEFSHSLDNTGSKYDIHGNLKNWWTPEDRKKYNRIVKDIIKQYETFASYDGIQFNAEITVGEDMADISGMALCQEYLCDYFDVNEVTLPIRELQLKEFYMHYATHQRQHIYKRAVSAQLGTNPHPLDKYRTNCVLARLDLFRRMFNIKKGDKMWWPTNNVNETIWN